MKVPQKYSPILFAFIMSILMALLMTAVVTLRLTGLGPGFLLRWFHAFTTAWPIAFPAVLLIAPVARKLAGRLTQEK
jgi:hypothetical protein